MIETELTTLLATIADNIYPVAAPLAYKTPAVVYNRISTDPSDDLDGSPEAGFVMFQIDVYDPSLKSALTVAKTIRQTLCGYTSDAVQGVSFHDERGMVDDTTQTRLYRQSLDFLIFTSLD